ncbi:MAG: hypothetical protein DRP64_19870 [Verrucomicrobia bacterium]|nr:MAG: hypothetical protein DRP64_19870 [Verrucomicrobiota bacterium]
MTIAEEREAEMAAKKAAMEKKSKADMGSDKKYSGPSEKNPTHVPRYDSNWKKVGQTSRKKWKERQDKKRRAQVKRKRAYGGLATPPK